MKAYQQIGISFLIGLGTFTYINKKNLETTTDREQPLPAPVVSNEDVAPLPSANNWGIRYANVPLEANFEGRGNVTVAVIDTGVDIHHPALKAALWNNPGESGIDENGLPKSMNGIDDDENGFIDDSHGWNFSNSSADVTDEHGHGTHIAGVIAGQGIGVAPNVSLMILKYYDSEGSGMSNLTNTIKAIHYAVKMGADIINYSGGGVFKSEEEEEALRWAEERGVLVVAAAGNEGMNSDFHPFYPADYDLDNIVSVTAVDKNSKLLAISNFGIHSVDLAAPGKNIYSTLPGGDYGLMTGTSQATAFVTGAAALLMSRNPSFQHDPPRMIAVLKSSGTEVLALRGKIRSGATLNAGRAIAQVPQEKTAQN